MAACSSVITIEMLLPAEFQLLILRRRASVTVFLAWRDGVWCGGGLARSSCAWPFFAPFLLAPGFFFLPPLATIEAAQQLLPAADLELSLR